MKKAAHLIRSLTPVLLRRAISRTGSFFGYGIDTHKKFPSIEGTLRTLHRLGLNPRFCIDVGAYHGEWAALFKTEFPESRILMIEAQQAKRPILERVVARHPQDISLEIALLGPADGQPVTFMEMETGSSVFAEASPYSRTAVEKTACRLDTLAARGKYPAVDFLKLDVQGYELEVLKGAPETLGQATAVLMEASLIPINAGCPIIGEVIDFMDSAGFQIFDFCSQSRLKNGALWQTDLLFLRKGSKILPQPVLEP